MVFVWRTYLSFVMACIRRSLRAGTSVVPSPDVNSPYVFAVSAPSVSPRIRLRVSTRGTTRERRRTNTRPRAGARRVWDHAAAVVPPPPWPATAGNPAKHRNAAGPAPPAGSGRGGTRSSASLASPSRKVRPQDTVFPRSRLPPLVVGRRKRQSSLHDRLGDTREVAVPCPSTPAGPCSRILKQHSSLTAMRCSCCHQCRISTV